MHYFAFNFFFFIFALSMDYLAQIMLMEFNERF